MGKIYNQFHSKFFQKILFLHTYIHQHLYASVKENKLHSFIKHIFKSNNVILSRFIEAFGVISNYKLFQTTAKSYSIAPHQTLCFKISFPKNKIKLSLCPYTLLTELLWIITDTGRHGSSEFAPKYNELFEVLCTVHLPTICI